MKIIAVDFDGTLSFEDYPKLGLPNLTLFEYLIKQRNLGNRVILCTCRERKELQDAINYCKKYGLEFDAVNENVKEITFSCRKVCADKYIDNLAVRENEFMWGD